jgi:hypothetical protein
LEGSFAFNGLGIFSPDKVGIFSPDPTRTTLTRILGTSLAACLSFYGAGSASLTAIEKQKQLDAAQHTAATAQKAATTALGTATRAQTQVNRGRRIIKTLQTDTAALDEESGSALALATTDDNKSKTIAADVTKLSIDTRRRLALTDQSARASAAAAAHSRKIAQSAAKSAHESQLAALAAAVQAGVYRLPNATVSAISSALSSLPHATSAYITCAPVLKELCTQIHGAFTAMEITLRSMRIYPCGKDMMRIHLSRSRERVGFVYGWLLKHPHVRSAQPSPV